MNDWMKRFQEAVRRFFQGRNGPDEMSLGLVIAYLILSLLMRVNGFGFLSLPAVGVFCWCLYRILSRNITARRHENEQYQRLVHGWIGEGQKFVNRLKKRKEYKYFKCPQCHGLIRLKRGSGEVDLTCPHCKAKIHQKA